jgi:hypothetical protein
LADLSVSEIDHLKDFTQYIPISIRFTSLFAGLLTNGVLSCLGVAPGTTSFFNLRGSQRQMRDVWEGQLTKDLLHLRHRQILQRLM